jgi:hypothetical protein
MLIPVHQNFLGLPGNISENLGDGSSFLIRYVTYAMIFVVWSKAQVAIKRVVWPSVVSLPRHSKSQQAG